VTVLLALWGRAKGWLIAAASALAIAAAVYVKGRSDQKTVDKNKDLKDRVESLKKAKEVSDEVHKMSPSDLDRELDRFMRD